MQRILIVALALLSLVVAAGLWLFLQKTITGPANPLTAVTGNAAVVIRTSDMHSFLGSFSNGYDMWEELETATGISGITSGIRFLDSLMGADNMAYELAGDKHLLLSLHPSGRDKYLPVFYIGTSSSREAGALTSFVKSLLEREAYVADRIYNRERIYDVTMPAGRQPGDFSFAVTDGIFILSLSPLLVENAIDQAASGDMLFDDDYFMKVYTTSGRNVDANIFLNLRNLPRYIASWTGGKTREAVAAAGELGDWAELDLHLRNDGILMNGFSVTGDPGESYLDIFSGQSPGEIRGLSSVPGYASAFMALGLSDVPLFHEQLRNWAENTGEAENRGRLEEQFMKLMGSDFYSAFHSFMEGEVALVMTGREEPESEGETFLMVRTRSRSQASEALEEMVRHHARLSGRPLSSYRETYGIDAETSFDILRFPFGRTGELLGGRAFGAAETAWYTFVDNYLVFGETVNGLSEFIYANVLNQTLVSDRRFSEFSEFLMSRSNFWMYSDIPRSAGLFTSLLNDEVSAAIGANLTSARKFQAASVQFSSGRDMLYNNLFLKYSPAVIEEPRTEWQTLLDTVIDFKPQLLVNHHTGENEIFVQDEENNIYLINRAGRILWKRPLPGRIMGNVYQIDLYRNNRLQMLFNTRDQIFLVDRNGNDVGRYPVRLSSPATNGISVFDYEGNRDYRIFVACEDRTVVVRSGDGNIITGWGFGRTEHNVYHEIKHIRSGGRDYIVFADRHRVYILDRRGNVRVRQDKVFPVAVHNNIVYEGRTPLSDPGITLTDTLGHVWHIGLDGSTGVVKLGDYSPGHFFDFQDVNADGYKDYIFIDGNRLDVYRRDRSAMFSHEFASDIRHEPGYYHFSRTDRKIGVVAQDKGQIFLFNSNGDIYEGFPLAGRSHFTIGFFRTGQGNFNLIVGSDYNFLYNYSVY